MSRTIFFDLDNTLYNYDQMSVIADRAIGEYCELQYGIPAEQAIRETYDSMNEITDRMGPSNSAVHDRMIRFKDVLVKHGLPVFPGAREMYELYWGTIFQHMTPEPGVYAFLTALKNRGFRIYCGTNMTSRIQYLKIQTLGMGSLFTDMITSEEACAEKPQKEFFLYCAKVAGVKPEECVFVGDDYELDIKGSRAAGMKGIHYYPEKFASSHMKAAPGIPVITDYRDLEACLRLVEGLAENGEKDNK